MMVVEKEKGSVDKEEFEHLAEQVDLILKRLDEHSNLLLDVQLKLHDNRIQRQRAFAISLKKQINVHFTVNVLNNIKLLTEKGETIKASEMSDGLSHLLRYANTDDEFIGGMEEFFILQKYVAIMEIRYPDVFAVDFDWDDRLSEVRMPRMMLQPIVENAIAHGFSRKKKNGRIDINACLKNQKIHISIRDNGVGIEAQNLEALLMLIHQADAGEWTACGIQHVALPNIQKRVYSYYGEGYGLQIDSSPREGTCVTLTIPQNCEVE